MPVHCLMDEYANLSLPKDTFLSALATMRSRGIFCSIIVQNMAQLKAMYKDDWESLVGLCDEFLYLGGTEKETHKYVSELLGKETISTTSYNQSKGRSGSYSINHQQSGRDLMTPDEVRLLDNSKCILFIRGERPVVDLKYNLLKHPNIRYTEDGGAAPYDYTAADNALERNPIVSKSEFVLSLFEQLIGDGMVTAKEKSILGRCTEQVYLPYIRNGYKGTPPTLQDFYRLLQMQPEPEAQGLALSSELFITGTLNTFARHTNVDTQARIIAYDIRELGEQLMPLGMLVTLDAIYNRVIQNWKKGRRTWIFCDEFYRARRSVT